MEVPANGLNLASANKHFHFYPKCARLRLVHLAFLDDLLLFA